jgi:hypothetical protein
MIMLRHCGKLRKPTLIVVLSLVCGCGDETTRMAGTIDLPNKERSRPDVKGLAKTKISPKSSKP